MTANNACCACKPDDAIVQSDEAVVQSDEAVEHPVVPGALLPDAHVISACSNVVPPNKLKWHDANGSTFDCEWYSHENRCASDGDKHKKFGMTANNACCVCKGLD
mmetsp:Transcript_25700/g.38132  ORF Transcript_25700/g.38132 Transcript_25700/m.38132 type:complete len:105 (-) Transcript_25700:275-589(-)